MGRRVRSFLATLKGSVRDPRGGSISVYSFFSAVNTANGKSHKILLWSGLSLANRKSEILWALRLRPPHEGSSALGAVRAGLERISVTGGVRGH